MSIEFDPTKDAANIAKHGVSLSLAVEMDITAYNIDDRYDYGEVRYRAFGWIHGVAHCLVFAMRDDRVRAISLRRAHDKEMKRNVK